MRRGRIVGAALLAAVSTFAWAGQAQAWNEGGTVDPWRNTCGTTNSQCHQMPSFSDHGYYATTSNKCSHCHTSHDAGGAVLLARPTVAASCNTCHDGSGGAGVYGTIAARGLTVGSGHRIDVTRLVPGGDAATGGDATGTFKGENQCLTCVDCHSPHRSQVVVKFYGDRTRYNGGGNKISDHLLKRKPGGTATETIWYGTDWCASCHRGRTSSSVLHNHPVQSGMYDILNIVAPGPPWQPDPVPTSAISVGGLGQGNSGYLMPYPRRGGQIGQFPICQQCHEDARNSGTLSADGNVADPTAFVAPADGIGAGNPRFQNFPHESTARALLVQENDDLCSNCHPPGLLP